MVHKRERENREEEGEECKRKKLLSYISFIHQIDDCYYPYYVPMEDVIGQLKDIFEAFQAQYEVTLEEALSILLSEELNQLAGVRGTPKFITDVHSRINEVLCENLWSCYKWIPPHPILLRRTLMIRHPPDLEEGEIIDDEDHDCY